MMKKKPTNEMLVFYSPVIRRLFLDIGRHRRPHYTPHTDPRRSQETWNGGWIIKMRSRKDRAEYPPASFSRGLFVISEHGLKDPSPGEQGVRIRGWCEMCGTPVSAVCV